jgi:TPR repeat protein
MLKRLLLFALLLVGTINAFDARLNNYPEARTYYDKATKEHDSRSAFRLALFYEDKLYDNNQAIQWYEKAYSMGSRGAPYNLGVLYQDNLNNYTHKTRSSPHTPYAFSRNKKLWISRRYFMCRLSKVRC